MSLEAPARRPAEKSVPSQPPGRRIETEQELPEAATYQSAHRCLVRVLDLASNGESLQALTEPAARETDGHVRSLICTELQLLPIGRKPRQPEDIGGRVSQQLSSAVQGQGAHLPLTVPWGISRFRRPDGCWHGWPRNASS